MVFMGTQFQLQATVLGFAFTILLAHCTLAKSTFWESLYIGETANFGSVYILKAFTLHAKRLKPGPNQEK